VATGSGFCRASFSEEDAEAEATLIAVIVTLGFEGSAAGGVYSPAAEMVPVAAVPPVTPFTCHRTAGFVVPVTVAENCVDEPMRVAEAPETMTAIWGVELPDEPLPQPAKPRRTAENRTTEAQRAKRLRDMEDLHTSVGSADVRVATTECHTKETTSGGKVARFAKIIL
jgi:hypothetical protein